MMNIEQLAIEHGAELTEEDTGEWDGMAMYAGNIVFHDKAQLEAFAKALQSSEPVAICSQESFGRGQVFWFKEQPADGTKLFTHPPASVPLEKYNKLLDALKFYADKNHVNFGDNLNKNFPNVFAMKYVPISGGEYPACIENGEVARQAIAEAEGEEG